uniref:Uncharacterized protein n=1 Tax=Marchantia polymorpha subsp. ruderalis TaxID=1480154 RepID=A0A176VJ08_MARPO
MTIELGLPASSARDRSPCPVHDHHAPVKFAGFDCGLRDEGKQEFELSVSTDFLPTAGFAMGHNPPNPLIPLFSICVGLGGRYQRAGLGLPAGLDQLEAMLGTLFISFCAGLSKFEL